MSFWQRFKWALREMSKCDHPNVWRQRPISHAGKLVKVCPDCDKVFVLKVPN